MQKKCMEVGMSKEEFYEVIDDIQKFYGKELTEMEVMVWENALANMEQSRFRKIADECFTSKVYMPKLATILEIDKMLPKKKIEQEQKEKVDCKYCDGAGVFEVEYETGGLTYSFGARCICENGEQYKEFKSIRDYGILRSDFFGNTSIYKLKPYVLLAIKQRLEKEKKK